MANTEDPCGSWLDADDLPCQDLGDSDLMEAAVIAASQILVSLTRRRWPGECSDYGRPIGRYEPGSWSASLSSTTRGMWSCGCNRTDRDGCCATVPEVRLAGPVIEVTEVKIDGAVLDPGAYRVDDDRYLVRIDGEGWPCCQDMLAADTEADTWSVAYTYGALPPEAGRRAAMALACELAKAYLPGDDTCRLPRRLTTIARQGVSMTVLDPLTLFPDGLTGLSEVDLWLGSLRFEERTAPAALVVPGRARRLRRPTV